MYMYIEVWFKVQCVMSQDMAIVKLTHAFKCRLILLLVCKGPVLGGLCIYDVLPFTGNLKQEMEKLRSEKSKKTGLRSCSLHTSVIF